jgi:hypothetical protein
MEYVEIIKINEQISKKIGFEGLKSHLVLLNLNNVLDFKNLVFMRLPNKFV